MKTLIYISKILLTLSALHASFVHAAGFEDNNMKEISDWDQRRIAAWRQLMLGNDGKSESSKVNQVNSFLNQIQYAEDYQQWGQKDYWATPSEFVKANAGDCEDFAIAKYFTLLAMGIPESRLRIAYVHSLKLKQAHMVLYYYPEGEQGALVLDNLHEKVVPASSRKDLIPVYAFNKQGLWLVKKGGVNQFVGSSKRLSRWQAMLQRMPTGILASL